MIKVDVIGKTTKIFFSTLEDVYKTSEEAKKYSCFNGLCNGFCNGFNYFKNFDESVNSLKYGWQEGTKMIDDEITKKYNNISNKTQIRNEYNIAGFQCSVPRYLQGIPTNMINQKRVPSKQKVMTVVKHIGFLGGVSDKEILENSAKALAIVKKIESQGTKCNLDIISPVSFDNGTKCVIRIRVKNANERLNIGKIAFAMANPDMLRRIMFALRLVCTEKEMGSLKKGTLKSNYAGASIYDRNEAISYLNPGEKYLHNFIKDVDDEVKKFEEMK